jgi:ketosteroid isomerase-like protein
MLAGDMDREDVQRSVVERYFKAMQQGPDGEDDLVGLFAEDAVYIEPFGGDQAPHVGTAQIRAWLRASWDMAPPELRLRVDRVHVEGDQVRADWTCTSPALPEPLRGVDRYTIRGGRIARLETRLHPRMD